MIITLSSTAVSSTSIDVSSIGAASSALPASEVQSSVQVTPSAASTDGLSSLSPGPVLSSSSSFSLDVHSSADFSTLSSTQPPSPSLSPSPSPLPSSTSSSVPRACATTVPNCEAFSGSLTASCPASSGRCNNGYLVLCGQAPTTERIIAVPGPTVDGVECQAMCENNPDCVGFTFSSPPFCSLWLFWDDFASGLLLQHIHEGLCRATSSQIGNVYNLSLDHQNVQ
jgi:hypothetical protein